MPNEIDVNDPHVLDLLVDGELTDAQERAVIEQLGQSPDGWRRCAMAFLENRCWQRAVGHVPALNTSTWQPVQRADDRPVESARHTLGPSATRRRSHKWSIALALCMLFLMAFGVGTLLPNPWVRFVRRPGGSMEQPAAPVQLAEGQAASAVTAPAADPAEGGSANQPADELLLVRPERGLLGRWADNLLRLFQAPHYEPFFEKSALYRIFIHQAILAGTVLAALAPDESVQLPHTVSYPLHMHQDYPPGRRPATVNELTTCRYDLLAGEQDWQSLLPVEEPLRSWLQRNLGP